MHYNRSVGRGLKLLALLNEEGDHRVSPLARATRLPRSTVFRILCTLVDEGYVWRDPATDIYHPTAMVLGLSDGFDGTARLMQAAQPVVTELGKRLIWPVMLATLSGTSVLLRQTTDASSPLAVAHYCPGYRFPALGCASGLVLLAFSKRQQRQVVLDLIGRYGAPDDPVIPVDAAERQLTDIRGLGYANLHRPGRSSERSSLAIPVQAGGDTLAALEVGFARNAVTKQVIIERFLPTLREAARSIAARFQQPPAAATAKRPRSTDLRQTEA